ncbi:M48 family metallopeptidase [Parafrankia sp. FMc6]|uniref:M48 metallopeptidase family protein n=1 Tax=Parafrankia soli TaxID=2599596 RepID=UPI0034D3DD10
MRPWANRMGVDITSLDVRDLSYRWGSLGTTGRINIHWAAMQLPVSLVGYVLVHELADTHERNHTELLANRRTHHA